MDMTSKKKTPENGPGWTSSRVVANPCPFRCHRGREGWIDGSDITGVCIHTYNII